MVQETAGSVSDHVFSVDCFLEKDDETADDSAEYVYYQKIVLMSLLPIFIALGSAAFWIPYAIGKKTIHFIKEELVMTIVVLIFIAHPNITKSMFSVFSCTEIVEDEYWIVSNLDIRCWTDTHTLIVIAVALPSILLWSIGIPAVALGFLIKSRKTLHTVATRIRFGYLYNGYETHTYYWEFVILYRKIAIICVSVFLGNFSIPV